ncbi:MAG: hypothetical protein ARM1_0639 [Candidatus Micrarchaeota archaeon]|nr:MAG: hypothetical protein ARM1_0639 [Candidatus Micrarchaeota archaeon]
MVDKQESMDYKGDTKALVDAAPELYDLLEELLKRLGEIIEDQSKGYAKENSKIRND